MKVLILFLLWTNFIRTDGEEAFVCDDTGEECPSKMCFYGIDHEHSCYRAGCATEEQCSGRRHNECFIANGLHTCCCMERGCAASYKGLSDCVDDPKNSTESSKITTSVTDVSSEENTNNQVSDLSTESYTTLPTEVPAVSAEVLLTTTAFTPSTAMSDKEEITTITRRGTIFATIPMTTKEVESSTEEITTSKITTRPTTSSSSTSTQTTTTTSRQTTTSRTTQPVTAGSRTRTTTAYTPRTSRYTTTQIPKETTTAHIEELRLLPDMPHVEQKQTITDKPRTTQRKPVTTTSMRTTTRLNTTPVRTMLPIRKEPVIEQVKELELTRADELPFTSSTSDVDKEPMMDDRRSSTSDVSEDATEVNVTTSSLVSVYEVTTLAVKNREEQWRPSVPWWAAVAMGFLVSVIVAWAVVFFLRKKKLREAETANRKSAEREAAVVDPLLKPSETTDN